MPGRAGPIGEQQVLDALGLAGNLETARLMGRVADRDAGGALEDIARLYGGGKDISAILGELASLTKRPADPKDSAQVRRHASERRVR